MRVAVFATLVLITIVTDDGDSTIAHCLGTAMRKKTSHQQPAGSAAL
jgi:hypothetical protein